MRKRMKRNGPTPSTSSRYFTNAKFMPHTTMVASAAISDQRSCDADAAGRCGAGKASCGLLFGYSAVKLGRLAL